MPFVFFTLRKTFIYSHPPAISKEASEKKGRERERKDRNQEVTILSVAIFYKSLITDRWALGKMGHFQLSSKIEGKKR